MPLTAYIAPMDYLLQTPAQLAKHLPSLRNARHLTQAQLGTLVGLDQTRIAKIEADPRRVSVGQLFKILSADNNGSQNLLNNYAREKQKRQKH